jgi:AcrR family transcriptional regulator
MHDLLRESILDAASDAATGSDWTAVRIADVAETVGVSRQTIYNEFGTKDQLGSALFEREITRFGDGMVEQVRSADSFRDAVRAAFTWMLEEAGESALLNRILTAHQHGDRESLLPILTVHADIFIRPLREQLAEVFLERWAGPTTIESQQVAEMVIRLGQSQVISPSSILTTQEFIEAAVEMAVAHTLMLARSGSEA